MIQIPETNIRFSGIFCEMLSAPSEKTYRNFENIQVRPNRWFRCRKQTSGFLGFSVKCCLCLQKKLTEISKNIQVRPNRWFRCRKQTSGFLAPVIQWIFRWPPPPTLRGGLTFFELYEEYKALVQMANLRFLVRRGRKFSCLRRPQLPLATDPLIQLCWKLGGN